MHKKIWFYICIFQTVIIVIGTLAIFLPSFTTPKAEEVDVVEFLDSYTEGNNFVPEQGYIPDSQTAKIVGSKIIDELTGESWFGNTIVEYDSANRLWLIHRTYLLNRGGFVVIEQDTGRVIKALLYK